MSSTMQERIAAMRQTVAAARKNIDTGGFTPLDVGVYVGALQKLEPREARKSGKSQIYREIVVTEGDDAGKSQKDWMNLEHEVGLAIACQFIAKHGAVAVDGDLLDITGVGPEDVFDLEASETQGKLIYGQLFLKVCRALEEAQPVYRFEITHRPREQGGVFADADVLEVKMPEEAAPAPAPAPAPAARGRKAPAARKAAPAPEDGKEELIAFANRQNVEVNDGMTLDQLTKAIGEFEYPMVGVSDEQLVGIGYKSDEINHDAMITTEEAALLESHGLSEAIIRPVAAAAGPRRRSRK